MARNSRLSNTPPGKYTSILLKNIQDAATRGYPFSIPAVSQLNGLQLSPGVTIFAGENGSGKSTIVEAIAVAAEINPEGGSKNFAFSTRSTESVLGSHVSLVCQGRAPRDAFFLRAECMYNVATEIDKLDAYGTGDRIINSYGGVSLHKQSHGEAFFAVLANRFFGNGLYLLDEPESALSPSRQFYLLQQMHRLVSELNGQIILATHSPILMSYPGAMLYWLDGNGIEKREFRQTDHYRVLREAMADPAKFIKNHVLSTESGSKVPARKTGKHA